jgi:hypothetical protein
LDVDVPGERPVIIGTVGIGGLLGLRPGDRVSLLIPAADDTEPSDAEPRKAELPE